MEKKKTSTKKSSVKVNPRVSDCYEETQGFTGQATSHKGVVIRKGKGGFEAPRFGLDNYRSLGAIKSAIDKLMKEKEGESVRDAEGNQKKDESFESSTGQGYYSERYKQIVDDAKQRFYEVAPPGKKYERMVKHIKKNVDDEGIAYATAWKHYNKKESAVPGKPAEKVGALTNIDIPQDERDAAKARLLAKAKAKREAMKKEEFEIEEGMTMKDFKANRRKLKRREASADAKKRGHVGKEWYNSGRTYSPDEAKSGRANMQDHERSTRHRSAIDPEGDDSNYSADKTKNPKKLRKQKAMGESLSFSQFMEGRAEDAQASLAKVKARQKVLDAHEKKTGKKLDISKSPEHKAHKQNFPGAKRQEKKVKGAKETSAEKHSRQVQTYNDRLRKYGKTKKQDASDAAMAKHTSRYD